MSETVLLTRKRSSAYLVNYHNGIKELTYKWSGYKKGGKPHTLAVPREVFDHLNMNTQAIKNGSLSIAEEQPNKEEIMSEIVEAEEAILNSRTYEQYVELLKGNINKMKKELKLITSRQEKMFVKQVKDDLANGDGLNNTKIDFIDEWYKSIDQE